MGAYMHSLRVKRGTERSCKERLRRGGQRICRVRLKAWRGTGRWGHEAAVRTWVAVHGSRVRVGPWRTAEHRRRADERRGLWENRTGKKWRKRVLKDGG